MALSRLLVLAPALARARDCDVDVGTRGLVSSYGATRLGQKRSNSRDGLLEGAWHLANPTAHLLLSFPHKTEACCFHCALGDCAGVLVGEGEAAKLWYTMASAAAAVLQERCLHCMFAQGSGPRLYRQGPAELGGMVKVWRVTEILEGVEGRKVEGSASDW